MKLVKVRLDEVSELEPQVLTSLGSLEEGLQPLSNQLGIGGAGRPEPILDGLSADSGRTGPDGFYLPADRPGLPGGAQPDVSGAWRPFFRRVARSGRAGRRLSLPPQLFGRGGNFNAPGSRLALPSDDAENKHQ